MTPGFQPLRLIISNVADRAQRNEKASLTAKQRRLDQEIVTVLVRDPLRRPSPPAPRRPGCRVAVLRVGDWRNQTGMSPGSYQFLQGDFIFPHFRDNLPQRAICFLLACLLQFVLKRFALCQ